VLEQRRPLFFTPAASPTVSSGTKTTTFSSSVTSWKSTLQHVALQRVMLDFLHQREAFGAGVVFDGPNPPAKFSETER